MGQKPVRGPPCGAGTVRGPTVTAATARLSRVMHDAETPLLVDMHGQSRLRGSVDWFVLVSDSAHLRWAPGGPAALCTDGSGGLADRAWAVAPGRLRVSAVRRSPADVYRRPLRDLRLPGCRSVRPAPQVAAKGDTAPRETVCEQLVHDQVRKEGAVFEREQRREALAWPAPKPRQLARHGARPCSSCGKQDGAGGEAYANLSAVEDLIVETALTAAAARADVNDRADIDGVLAHGSRPSAPSWTRCWPTRPRSIGVPPCRR